MWLNTFFVHIAYPYRYEWRAGLEPSEITNILSAQLHAARARRADRSPVSMSDMAAVSTKNETTVGRSCTERAPMP